MIAYLSKYIIDGHNDLLILLRILTGNHIYGENFKKKFEEGGLEGHVDIPRMNKGKYGGAFWSAFMPCPRNVTDFDDENYFPSTCFLAIPPLYQRRAMKTASLTTSPQP